MAIPTTPERSFLVCLSYPFRNAAGMALLVFIPPLIWFGSVPLFGLIPMVRGGSQLTLFALILTGPPLVVLFFALGHALLFLGDVVVTSCLGAVILPRPASWDPGDIVRAWALWVWALVVGGCVGAWPALLYWFRCGDVDWFDQVVLIDLIMPGLAYGQLALVLALTEDSPWSAANPLRVMGTIWRGGWTLLWPCLVTGVFLVLAIGLLVRCLELGNDLMQAVAFWAWWVLGLYLAMVALRWLGLFCYRSRVIAISPRRVRQQS